MKHRPYQDRTINPADPCPNELLDLFATIHFITRPDQGLSHREGISLLCDIYNRIIGPIRKIESKHEQDIR